MTPTEIEILVDSGAVTRAEADAWIEHIMRMRRIGWKARIKRRIARVILAPFRWLDLTRLQ